MCLFHITSDWQHSNYCTCHHHLVFPVVEGCGAHFKMETYATARIDISLVETVVMMMLELMFTKGTVKGKTYALLEKDERTQIIIDLNHIE